MHRSLHTCSLYILHLFSRASFFFFFFWARDSKMSCLNLPSSGTIGVSLRHDFFLLFSCVKKLARTH